MRYADTVDYDAVRSSTRLSSPELLYAFGKIHDLFRVVCRRKVLQLGAVVRELEDRASYVLFTVFTQKVRTRLHFGYRRVQKTLRLYRDVGFTELLAISYALPLYRIFSDLFP